MKPGNRISGILFDLGGVLVALDGMPALASMLKVAPLHETVHAFWMSSPAVQEHESGKISAAQFAERVVADLNLAVGPNEFLEVFMQWPTNIHPGVAELIGEIASSYRIAALSNTSAVHWQRLLEMGLGDLLTERYLSHEIGHLKPTPGAYLAALSGMNLAAEEVLFLDDGPANVDAARVLGMHAHVARGPAEARSVLADYGIVQRDN